MAQSANLDFQEIYDFLVSVAYDAGKMITGARRPRVGGTGVKMNSVDLVTETDKAVEDMVARKLREQYPDIGFLGEESYVPASSAPASSLATLSPSPSLVPLTPTFIVDPIDGTTNFVHQYPYVSISLGLAVQREPVVGVVYNPYTEQLYTAISGQGAYLTDRHGKARLPLPGTAAARAADISKQPSTSPTNDGEEEEEEAEEDRMKLSTSLIAIEWGSIRSGNDWSVKWRTFEKLGRSDDEKDPPRPEIQPPNAPNVSSSGSTTAPTTSTTTTTTTTTNPPGPPNGAMVHSLRSLGSAALNLCAVASGTIDAYWEAGPWPWDFCAGFVVVREAGGVVVDAQRPLLSGPKPRTSLSGSGSGSGSGPDRERDVVNASASKSNDLQAARATLGGRRCLAVRAGPGHEQEAFIREFWDCVVGRFEVGG